MAAWLASAALYGPAAAEPEPLAQAFGQAGALPALLLGSQAPAAAIAAPASQPVSSLFFGRCALGPAQACFARLLAGLAPQDRPFVRLADSAVAVDPRHGSASANFQALQRVCGRRDDRTEIEVLTPAQSFTILSQITYPGPLVPLVAPMGSPKTNDGFEGYTFFPLTGAQEPGVIYTPGSAVLVEVNTDQSLESVTETIHHELRHVLLGDFGRSAALSKHGLPAVEEETRQAEDEARLNAGQP